jgi:hypothetical protein
VEVCTDVCCCCCYFTVAKLSINNKFYHYTVLFKREENNVSDSLSWGTTTDEAKSLLLLTFCTLVFSTRCQSISELFCMEQLHKRHNRGPRYGMEAMGGILQVHQNQKWLLKSSGQNEMSTSTSWKKLTESSSPRGMVSWSPHETLAELTI